MGRRADFSKYLLDLDAQTRLERAKEITRDLTDEAVQLLELNESNKLLVLSDVVTSKVTDGRAIQALNAVRSACARYEAIRVMALWEKPEQNRKSIPTAVKLIESPEVLDLIWDELASHWQNIQPRILNPTDDPELHAAIEESIRVSNQKFAAQQVRKAKAALRKSFKRVSDIIIPSNIVAAENTRNHLAHLLSETYAEGEGKTARADMLEMHGLLNDSIQIIESLYLWVNGTSFDIRKECRSQAKGHAAALWHSLRFEP